jgi:hypothetical protein
LYERKKRGRFWNADHCIAEAGQDAARAAAGGNTPKVASYMTINEAKKILGFESGSPTTEEIFSVCFPPLYKKNFFCQIL